VDDITKVVLDAMRAACKPIGAGEIVKLTGLDRTDVDKAMAALKKGGEIESPARCLWQPKG